MFMSASIGVKAMKLRSTTPSLKQLASSSTLVAAAVLAVVASPLAMTNSAYADRFDDAIRAKEQEISQYQKEASKLAKEGDTLQAAVSKITAQKQTIQGQVDLSQAKYDKLQSEIEKTKQRIKKNQSAFAENVENLYADGTITPLEILAGSDSVGDFITNQEQRLGVNDEIGSNIETIAREQKKLSRQKDQAEQVLNDQKSQRDALAAKESERQKLLNETRGQESAYNSLSAKRNQEISGLRAQQASENAARAQQYGVHVTVSAGGGGGGYPSYLAGAPMDSLVDPWGMYNRECVSYAAWKVHQAYGNMPYWGGYGNANQWLGNARSSGIPTGSTPKPGSVAVMMSGYYGHVAWVESVSGGMVHVSQYNWDMAGSYSEMTVPASFFDGYIYFGR